MEYGKAFTFPFEDQDWIKKVLIAGVIGLIPIVGQFFLLGWGLEITRRVIKSDLNPLPAWDNFGGYFVDGLKALVIGFVYTLPVILVQSCGSALLFGANETGDDTFIMIGSTVMACFSCFTILWVIFIAFMLSAALGNYAATDEFGAAFRIGEIYELVRNAPAAYIMVLLTWFITPFIALLGLMFCLVGGLFTFPYAMMANQYMQGEAYRVAKLEVAGYDTGIQPEL
jgi:hypothetical protein